MDTEVLFRDEQDIQPPQHLYTADTKRKRNIYTDLAPANFVACQEDIWQPLPQTVDDGGDKEIKVRFITNALPSKSTLFHLYTSAAAG